MNESVNEKKIKNKMKLIKRYYFMLVIIRKVQGFWENLNNIAKQPLVSLHYINMSHSLSKVTMKK